MLWLSLSGVDHLGCSSSLVAVHFMLLAVVSYSKTMLLLPIQSLSRCARKTDSCIQETAAFPRHVRCREHRFFVFKARSFTLQGHKVAKQL